MLVWIEPLQVSESLMDAHIAIDCVSLTPTVHDNATRWMFATTIAATFCRLFAPY